MSLLEPLTSAQLSGLTFLPDSSAQLRRLTLGELLLQNSRFATLLRAPLTARTRVVELLELSEDDFALIFNDKLAPLARSLHRLLTTIDSIHATPLLQSAAATT